MRTLIVYSTTHGCTEKCALTLKDRLAGETETANLKKAKPDLKAFDTVIIGGSIHAGRVQNRIKQFCSSHSQELKEKKLGLYLCCMEEGEKAQKQFDDAYPQELREHASAAGLFGGAFDFEKMNPIERAIIKKIAKIDKSINRVSEEKVHAFAEKMKQ